MGAKPNQRVALTKEMIHRALIGLLKSQEIHKITIRELCDIAGINRTTFYNHYGSYRLLQNWIAADARRSAGEMARIIMRLANGVCCAAEK